MKSENKKIKMVFKQFRRAENKKDFEHSLSLLIKKDLI